MQNNARNTNQSLIVSGKWKPGWPIKIRKKSVVATTLNFEPEQNTEHKLSTLTKFFLKPPMYTYI